MEHTPVYYRDYLQLDKIIDAQAPVSFTAGKEPAHEEMLFIIIHQAYELWFKQILFEVESVIAIMNKPAINDNSPELSTIVHRLKRVATIQNVLVHQVDILETMTPMEFLNFRDMLRPASGFQSWQFKIIEAKLGLKFDQRHGQNYYTSQLKPAEIDIIKSAEDGPSVLVLINQWLERMPFFDPEKYWSGNSSTSANITSHPFWAQYHEIYASSLNDGEKNNLASFEGLFFDSNFNPERSLSPAACRSALFIMLYRGYPMLEHPFQVLDTLLEIDNQFGNWRNRHINMVKRMIGSRVGTGGSTGAGYLQGAMDKHNIFREISQLNSFLVDARKLPTLPISLIEKLGYNF